MNVSEDNRTFSNIVEQIPNTVSSTPNSQGKQISEAYFVKQHSQNFNSTKSSLSALWTTHATSTLVKLYEAKLEMLETPKKKTRIWNAIAKNLKDYDINVTPDQVRWKINALTKKYKHCMDVGKLEKFKYFKEMDKIYSKYNVDCDSYSITEILSKKNSNYESINDSATKPINETKAMIEMRKARLVNRINCDRFQGKIKLERQWLEYLHRQEEQTLYKDIIFERNLKLRKDKLETRKKDLELRESVEYKQTTSVRKRAR